LAEGQAGALMLAGRYPEGALAATRPSASEQEAIPAVVNAILPLAVSVATQQTPSGVASALDASAQRVTIHDLRSERAQLSFSGQFGLAVSYDVPASGGAQGVENVGVVGLTAPLGIGLSVPLGGTYISLHLSMLDPGQLAALPLGSKGKATRGMEEVTVAPVPTTKVHPEQFLAPGFFVGVAIPKTAILVSGGLSFAPRLREYEQQDANGGRFSYVQYSTMRYGLKMVVDLPFLEFF
jgi:hypothetical protein